MGDPRWLQLLKLCQIGADVHKHFVDILSIQCRYLIELQSLSISVFSEAFRRNYPCVLHIAFIADDVDLRIVTPHFFDEIQPGVQLLK